MFIQCLIATCNCFVERKRIDGIFILSLIDVLKLIDEYFDVITS